MDAHEISWNEAVVLVVLIHPLHHIKALQNVTRKLPHLPPITWISPKIDSGIVNRIIPCRQMSPVSCHWKTKPGLRNASKMLRKSSKYSTYLRFRQGASFWTEAVVGQIQALETRLGDSPEWTRVDESWGSVMDNPHPDPFKGSIVSSNLASRLGNKLAKA